MCATLLLENKSSPVGNRWRSPPAFSAPDAALRSRLHFFVAGQVPGELFDRKASWGETTEPDPRRKWLEGSSSNFQRGMTFFFELNKCMYTDPCQKAAGLTMINTWGATTDPDPCRKAKAGGSRMLMLGAGRVRKQRRNYWGLSMAPDSCRKAEAGGSRMLILWGQEYIYIYAQYIYICIHVYIHDMNIYMYTYMYIGVCMCIYTHIFSHAYVYVRTHVVASIHVGVHLWISHVRMSLYMYCMYITCIYKCIYAWYMDFAYI